MRASKSHIASTKTSAQTEETPHRSLPIPPSTSSRHRFPKNMSAFIVRNGLGQTTTCGVGHSGVCGLSHTASAVVSVAFLPMQVHCHCDKRMMPMTMKSSLLFIHPLFVSYYNVWDYTIIIVNERNEGKCVLNNTDF